VPPFSAVDHVRRILKWKWVILAASLVAGIGAYVYSLSLPNYYKSTVNCVPASNDESLLGGATGGLSSALKDFGLTKLTKSSGPSYEFVVVLFSRQICDSMIKRFDLVHEYELEDKPMQAVRDQFNENLEVNLRAEGNYEITIWSTDAARSVEMCKAFVEYANYVANLIYRKEADKTSSYLTDRVAMIDSVLDACADSLDYYSKTYLMFSPDNQAMASAKALGDARAALLQQQTVLGVLQRSYGADDPQTRSQAAIVGELERQYDDLVSKPGIMGNFSIKDAAGIGAGYMRVLTEFEAHAKLKAIVLPTLEQAKLDRAKKTPSLIVVDDPVPIEKKDRPRRTVIGAGAALGTGLLIIVLILLIHAWKDFIRQPTA
jgi:capsule polysaccharide export protein KpsE/RkpR